MAARFAGSSATAPVGREERMTDQLPVAFERSGVRTAPLGEFLDSAIDRLLEGVDLMLPHKLHEFATSVRGTVNMEDVPREFLSISLNDHGKELS